MQRRRPLHDSCFDGACTGQPVVCPDDGNPCTDDLCLPGTPGADFLGCNNVPTTQDPTCDDRNPCTENDACSGGVCVGTQVDCDDGIACTNDTCDTDSGECEFKPDNTLCDDDRNPCTEDVCDPENENADFFGCITLPPREDLSCDDDDACTTNDMCTDGDCAGKLINCDDGKRCTEDSCKPKTGCVHTAISGPGCEPVPRDCTFDAECNDNIECTIDRCDTATGKCNHDTETGVFCLVAAIGDPCRTSTCDPTNPDADFFGCVPSPTGTACDDGNLCTVDDGCVFGNCTGLPKDCDDGERCT